MSGSLQRLAAFTTTAEGGNPAGVWIGDALPDVATMQRVAAEVGDSETAFVAPASGRERTIRYYSPRCEVPFCGHATIAAGVALGNAEGDGLYRLATRAGEVPVAVRNPFPVGGVVEDPATGAAAAALGGYLRDAKLVAPPMRLVLRQGETMGRPSRLVVDVPERGGIVVSGSAVPIPPPGATQPSAGSGR